METGLKQDRLWISLWVFELFVLLRMRMGCAGEAVKGVARSRFPGAASADHSSSEALAASAFRAASRDRMRFFALALLCRKR